MIDLSPQAAAARLGRVDGAAYAATRNHLEGAVSGLSPWLVHGAITPQQCVAAVHQREPLPLDHRWVQELAWRGFFQHRLHHDPDSVWHSRHAGVLPEGEYANSLPDDVAQGRTGLAVIDRAVQQLHTTGLLHNHARLWLASYLVHGRRVHWRVGADWMYSLLLDGDVASNHGSWQWVAGTGSSKPYLFNADNVARFAPADWQVPGSPLDAPYATHEARANGALPALPALRGGRPSSDVLLPPTSRQPPLFDIPGPALQGRRVHVVHPWALAEPPAGADLVLALWPTDAWAALPWRLERWAAVAQRMAALSSHQWVATSAELAARMADAAQVSGTDHARLGAPLRRLMSTPAPSLFPALLAPGAAVHGSFSAYWRAGTRGLDSVEALLAA
jgi:deoxyribodipyrimidine photo-lyase